MIMGYDAMSAHLEGVVDGRATVEDAQDFAGLAARMEGERELEQMVERELRHLCEITRG